jgi:hypothetical protein
MKGTFSKVLLGLSWVAFGLALWVGLFWLTIVIDHDGRGSLGFRYLFAPVFGGGFLLLAICSGVLYFRQRQRRDLYSMILSSVSCLSILGETVALFFVPLHGPW